MITLVIASNLEQVDNLVHAHVKSASNLEWEGKIP